MKDEHEISPITRSKDSGLGVVMFDSLLSHFSGKKGLSNVDPGLLKRMRQEFESSEFFGEDMRNLWVMLERIQIKANLDPGYSKDSIDLLNLACGYCEEGAILPAFWGRSGQSVQQFSVDLRDAEIDKARRRYAATESIFKSAIDPKLVSSSDGSSNVEFIADNAVNLSMYGQIPSKFDIVFIRHQNLWHDRKIWQKIYDYALSCLSDSGVLIITSYFDREHMLALELIKLLGGKVLVTEKNESSRELDFPGKSIDRHVAAIALTNPQ
ncbi:MAG: hypothetical protein CMO38_06935 [Verrucomicrobiaceae bacterium]|nr:hypothetical protein [Verrucomicrobiaceae bacterium]